GDVGSLPSPALSGSGSRVAGAVARQPASQPGCPSAPVVRPRLYGWPPNLQPGRCYTARHDAVPLGPPRPPAPRRAAAKTVFISSPSLRSLRRAHTFTCCRSSRRPGPADLLRGNLGRVHRPAVCRLPAHRLLHVGGGDVVPDAGNAGGQPAARRVPGRPPRSTPGDDRLGSPGSDVLPRARIRSRPGPPS